MKYDELVDHIEDALGEVEGNPEIETMREAADFVAEWLTTETELFVNRGGELDFQDVEDELPTSTGPGGSSEHVPGT